MKKIHFSIIALNSLFFQVACAHENSVVIIDSSIESKIITSIPSDEFLDTDITIGEGTKFPFKTAKVIEVAKVEAKKIKGFSDQFSVTGLSMQAYPHAYGDKWYFVVSIMDDKKNLVNVIVNSNYKSWPFGQRHDPFEE